MNDARYSCVILMEFEYSQQIFRKNTQIPNFLKIRPVGAELFLAGRRTDMTKLIVALPNFANGPKNFGDPHSRTRHWEVWNKPGVVKTEWQASASAL